MEIPFLTKFEIVEGFNVWKNACTFLNMLNISHKWGARLIDAEGWIYEIA